MSTHALLSPLLAFHYSPLERAGRRRTAEDYNRTAEENGWVPVKETWMMYLNEGCMINTTNAHLDPKLDTSLAQKGTRESLQNTFSASISAPDDEASSSPSDAEKNGRDVMPALY